MEIAQLLDYVFLFLFCAVEMGAYVYFLSTLERKEETWRINCFYLVLATILLFVCAVFSMTKNYTRDIYSYGYTAVYYITLILWILMVYRVNVREAVYHAVLILLSTRALRHCFGHIMIITMDYNYLVEGNNWLFRLVACIVLLGLYILLFSQLRKFLISSVKQDISWLHLSLVVSTVLPVIYIGALAETLQDEWGHGMDAVVLEIIASVCGVFSVLGYRWMLEVRKRELDLAHMEKILRLQHRQYETKKETMELINQKYHDLKKSLKYLEQFPGTEYQNQAIRSLQKELSVYDTIYQTGNETLDVVLFDKNERCQKAGIRLIFMLDGADLSFLDPFDITAIFGNALDNAIEQAEKMERSEYKEITMKCSSRPGWVVLRFENYCDPNQLVWKGETLLTTKEDVTSHGFGLGSIEYATKKHGGNMTIEVKNKKFVMNIMFPCILA